MTGAHRCSTVAHRAGPREEAVVSAYLRVQRDGGALEPGEFGSWTGPSDAQSLPVDVDGGGGRFALLLIPH